MTPEAQRIAIAEACGWKHIDYTAYDDGVHGCPPYAKIGEPGMENLPLLPDYLNDLNAMHEAEKVLTAQQQSIFVTKLCDIAPNHIGQDWRWLIVHATAAQRAEAFLRTIGKWEGGK